MAWIYKNKRKQTSPSDRKRLRSRLYNDTTYRKIRDWYMQTHPLCEICESEGRIVPSEHCHHVDSPFQIGISEEEAWRRLRDERNFKALCADCHEKIHVEQERMKKNLKKS